MVKVRKAKNEDLERIAELFKEEYAKEPYNDKWTKEKALKKIRTYFKNRIIFVAENEVKIIGFIIADKQLWYKGYLGMIEEIVVANEFQGYGIGKKLMTKIQTEFKKDGVIKMHLFACPKAHAYDFYKKLGYKKDSLYVIMYKKL